MSDYLARYDASYRAMLRQAERNGLISANDKKGPYKANLTRYGLKPAPGSDAARVQLEGRG